MKKPVIVVAVSLAVLSGAAIFLSVRTSRGRELAEARHAAYRVTPFKDPGSVRSLTIMPVVDFYSSRADLRTEPGVAYIIRADDTTILLDLGYNMKKEHPSPLLHNMAKLGLSFADVDVLFFSHIHPDHVGGMKEFKTKTFRASAGKADMGAVRVFAPETVAPSPDNPVRNVTVKTEPFLIAPGIASTGAIPRHLFLLGPVEEQSLAVNLEGKGIVLIVGCGHPTVEKIVKRAEALFGRKVYAVAGGLHFPVKGGRGSLGPVNVQYIVGSDTPPWRGLTADDVRGAAAFLKARNIRRLVLSPHDSSDWSLGEIGKAFGDGFGVIRAGELIVF